MNDIFKNLLSHMKTKVLKPPAKIKLNSQNFIITQTFISCWVEAKSSIFVTVSDEEMENISLFV